MSKYIISCFLFLLFTSCEDFFATTIEVDPPVHEEQIVFQTFPSNLNTTLEASVSKSVGLLEDIELTKNLISDATVELFEGDNLITDLVAQEVDPQSFISFNYKKNTFDPIFKEGKTYTYKINHSEFGEVSATQTMPFHVPLTASKYREGTGVDMYGERTDEASIIFQDPAGEANYYEIVLAAERDFNGILYYENIWATTNDLNVFASDYGSTMLLSDEALDGKEYNLVLNFNAYGGFDENKYFVFWRSVTEDYFLYAKSVSLFQEASDFGGFAEPVSLHSNINNGLGIFAVRSEQIYQLVE